MRLHALDVIAFGSLAGVRLELGRTPALHVILGDNEAGKSTALRALRGLFYGIPETTLDAHTVGNKALRVGAELCDAAGRELYVQRRKGRKQTLLDAEGKPLGAEEEAWISAGTPEALFEKLFGLSHATLERQALSLLDGGGDLGRSLFEAGLGGRAVHDVQNELERQANELFRPRGTTQALSLALARLEECKQRMRDAAVSAEAFAEQEKAMAAAERDAQRLRAEVHALRAEQSRLKRARLVLPQLATRAALLSERSALGDVRALREDEDETRRAAEQTLRVERVRMAEIRHKRDDLARELETLHVPDALAKIPRTTIGALRDGLGPYKRARTALPQELATHAHMQRDLERLLSGLPGEIALGDVERLRVKDTLIVQIREHALRRAAIHGSLADVERALERKQLERELRTEECAQHLLARAAAPKQPLLPLFTRAALPSDARVDEFERQLSEVQQERSALDEKAQQWLALDERTRCDLEALTGAGHVVTEAELARARDARQACWSKLRARVTEAGRDAGAPPGALAELLAEHEALSRVCDELADRLRREASRVADHARLTAERESHARTLAQVARSREACDRRYEALSRDWAQAFADAGLQPLLPRELRSWLAEYGKLEAQCEALALEIQALQRERELRASEVAAWQQGWRKLVSVLGLAQDASSGEADAALGALRTLFTQVDAARRKQDEIAALQREIAAFEAEVEAAGREHLPEHVHAHGLALADEILARHEQARSDLAQRARVAAELAARDRELQSAAQACENAERTLHEQMQAAGVSDLAALALFQQRSAMARELDAKLAQNAEVLAQAGDGASLEALEREVCGVSVDDAIARLSEIEHEIEAAETEEKNVRDSLVKLRLGDARLRESQGAADAAAEVAEQVAVVRALVERYVQLRLASRVLQTEVERYRERNKAPILDAASALFARLTLQRYVRLDVDYDEADTPVIVCVRGEDERQVRIEGLSTGTCDQLYLALRLASIAHLGQSQELMPLLLDDVLVHFDDERARAALVVLGEFSQVTQVLFFTHHARLLELAQAAVPEACLRTHRLPSPRGAPSVLRPSAS